ncbi:transposase [Megasphaera sp. UBA4233]|uniref:transposase n=1 Tax=Megasphaera sp. UBA4233 TaxID=1946847 RepID=UPI0025C5A9F2|nr:transposase [Megasphaera sp. UBA4233]
MVLRIFDRYVHIARKLLPPKILSLDEHYLPDSDYDSFYCSLLMDFVTDVIIDILPDRKKSYLLYYLSHIKHETYSYETHTSELGRIQYVSIDMSESFRSVFQSYCPQAIICADSFHVLQHLTKDFNAVRLKCRRETPDPVLAYVLMKFKVVLNYNVQLDNVARYNKRLTVLSNWKQEIVNSFTVVNGRRINNSYIESKNRQVQRLLNNANGFCNFKRTRNRILYYLNKEDTYTF